MSSSPTTLKTTPLHDRHQKLGARMMEFGGFEMPVQYTGIIEEHKAVRTRAGLFDISHMGEVLIEGSDALDFIQRIATNDMSRLYDGRATYTVMCQPDGGIVDDFVAYQLREDAFMAVINAANIEKDVSWMRTHNFGDVEINNISDETALLALQGPKSFEIAQSLTDADLDDLKFYHFTELTDGSFLDCDRVILSYTGYTGERGLEIYCAADEAGRVWDAILEAGEEEGLLPTGLGARDTLRLEAGLCLYGNDITADTNPLEAGLSWVVKFDKGDFIGRDALLSVQRQGPDRKRVGFVADERGIPRNDHAILDPDRETRIGTVTSGSQSPMLEKGIGMGYVPNDPAYTEPGASLRIDTGRRQLAVTVAEPPFHEDA